MQFVFTIAGLMLFRTLEILIREKKRTVKMRGKTTASSNAALRFFGTQTDIAFQKVHSFSAVLRSNAEIGRNKFILVLDRGALHPDLWIQYADSLG